MRTISYQALRTIANEKAANSNNNFNKAKVAFRKKEYWKNKVDIIRNFLLNSPWVLFTILYFLILIVDAVLMKPIIQVVVEHGFKMESEFSLYLFVIIYILLVTGLTIGVAYGFSKLLDHKLRELQIELETYSRQNVAKSIIEAEVLEEEDRERKLGILFAFVLFALLISLSLYRNYIVNEFTLKFDSPDDWLNLIIPIALGIALCFFGLYKDTVVKLLRFKAKEKKYENEREVHQTKSDSLARQAIEQAIEADRNGETIPSSAELIEVKNRYTNRQQTESTFYDDNMEVKIQLMAKGLPVPNVQVTAITGDNITLFSMSDVNGIVLVKWNSTCDYLRNIRIGPYSLEGTKWVHGSLVNIDLEDLLNKNQNNSSYLADKLLTP